MNPKYQLHEQIDRYLKNDLSEEELVAFDKNLLNNEEFKNVFEAQQEAHELIVDNELIKLKERMTRDLSGPTDNDSLNWGKILVVSATIGFLGVFAYFQFTRKDKGKIETTTNVSIPKDRSELTDDRKTLIEKNSSEVIPKVKNTDNVIIENKSIPNVQVNDILDDELSYEIKQMNTNTSSSETNTVLPEKTTAIKDEGKKIISFGDNYGNIVDPNEKSQINLVQKDIDEVFTPSLGETWTFPIDNGRDGSISIINKAGITVYSATILGGYPKEWDGRDSNGNEVNAGSYYFVLNFSNNELLKGKISVVK